MASDKCPQCEAVLKFIEQWKEHPTVSYEVIGPINNIFRDIKAIIDRKIFLPQAKKGKSEDYRMYNKIRHARVAD